MDNSRLRSGRGLALLVLCASIGSLRCANPPAYEADHRPPSEFPVEHLGALNNVVEIDDTLINGSAPLTDADFDGLKRLGVRTIIGVDGAPPDVERAAARGMRYVHIPFGYDGIPAECGVELTRAVRDLPKPVYVHCYHGKHRGPAATAFVLVSLGRCTPEEGVELMKHVGTSKKYPGLYESVREAKKLSDATLDAAPNEFPSRAKVSGFVQMMVHIDRCWEQIGHLRDAGWKQPADHPDLDAVQETRILAQAFDDLSASDGIKARPADFREYLEACRSASHELRDLIAHGDAQKAAEIAIGVEQACDRCHIPYRN